MREKNMLLLSQSSTLFRCHYSSFTTCHFVILKQRATFIGIPCQVLLQDVVDLDLLPCRLRQKGNCYAKSNHTSHPTETQVLTLMSHLIEWEMPAKHLPNVQKTNRRAVMVVFSYKCSGFALSWPSVTTIIPDTLFPFITAIIRENQHFWRDRKLLHQLVHFKVSTY